jgi:lysophospholipase L1-like esterase
LEGRLDGFILTPHLATMQNPNDMHFNDAGYNFLGGKVAESMQQALQRK